MSTMQLLKNSPLSVGQNLVKLLVTLKQLSPLIIIGELKLVAFDKEPIAPIENETPICANKLEYIKKDNMITKNFKRNF